MKTNSSIWKKPDPFVNRWLVWSIAIYIILVLNLLEPFGINIPYFIPVYHLILSSYGLVSALVVALTVYWLNPQLVKRWPNWSPKAVLAWFAVLVFVVSVANWLYSLLLHYLVSGWKHMYVPIRGFTDLVPQFLALYSIWALICWANLYFSHKLQPKAAELQPADAILNLNSNNQSDHLRLKASQLICLKTCDNYLEVYYLDEQERLQKRLIRSSMKRMQLELDEQQEQNHFYRSHQSYLVNVNKVKGIKKYNNSYALEVAFLDFDVLLSRKNLNYFQSVIKS